MNIAENLNRLMSAKSYIRDAIINKGVEVPIDSKLDEFPPYILDIKGGGEEDIEEPTEFIVRWVDWDGTTLKEELLPKGAISTAPTAPSHPHITFNKWCEGDTVTVIDHNVYNIASYTPIDNDKIYAVLKGELVYFCINRSVTSKVVVASIDWGDGNIEEVGTESTWSIKGCEHIYNDGLNEHNVIITKLAPSSTEMRLGWGAPNATTATGTRRTSYKTAIIGNGWLLGYGAFYEGRDLKGVVLPHTNNNNLPQSVFSSCINLEYVSLPSNYTIINNYCFYQNFHLLCVGNFNKNEITKIGHRAFYRCYNLNMVIDLPYLEWLDTNDDTNGGVFQECLNIRRVKNLGKITTLWYGAFSYCRNLLEVILPETLTTIRNNTFYYCVNLRKMDLPQSITYIGQYSFRYCLLWNTVIDLPNLETLSITTHNTNAYYTFADCNRIRGIESLGKIKIIPSSCFLYCRDLEYCYLPNTLEIIESAAFNNCSKLKTLGGFPSSITAIYQTAFRQCYLLEDDIDLPNLETLGAVTESAYTFGECRNIKKIISLGKITAIPKYTFSTMINLVEMNLPNSITDIGDSAFEYLVNLKVFNIPTGLTTLTSSFFREWKSVERLVIPNHITNLSTSCIYDMYNLRYLYLPKGLTFANANSLDGLYSLEVIEVEEGFVPNQTLYLNDSVMYTREMLVNLFNNLGTTSTARTLQIGNTNLNRLTAEDKAIATNKGYTLSN